jgi:hypothetical protein
MKNLIVIDNFYRHPVAVREYALSKAKYLPKEQTPQEFAGTESIQGFYSDELIQKIETNLGKQIDIDTKRFAFGVFSKTTEQDSFKKTVHVDSSQWTGILYLSKPEHCRGGTTTYKHIKTGWTEIPNDDVLQNSAYGSRTQFIDQEVTPNGRDFSKWEVSVRAGMVFNRMVLMNSGQLFHSAESYFGNCDENCRLTQLFFFNTKE